METGPSKITETLVYWLLPPACREEIIGDMRERNQSWSQFLIEATHTVPSVIYSQIRRTVNLVVVLAEAVSLYTAFVLSAWSLDRDLLLGEYAFAKLALPPAIFLAAIILADVYSDSRKRWPLKPLFGPTLGFALTIAIELNHKWSLPVSVLIWGGALSVLIASGFALRSRQSPSAPN